MLNTIKCFLNKHKYKTHKDQGINKKYQYNICVNCHKIDTTTGNFWEMFMDILEYKKTHPKCTPKQIKDIWFKNSKS